MNGFMKNIGWFWTALTMIFITEDMVAGEIDGYKMCVLLIIFYGLIWFLTWLNNDL